MKSQVLAIGTVEPNADGNRYRLEIDGKPKLAAGNLDCLASAANRLFAGQPAMQAEVQKTIDDFRQQKN